MEETISAYKIVRGKLVKYERPLTEKEVRGREARNSLTLLKIHSKPEGK